MSKNDPQARLRIKAAIALPVVFAVMLLCVDSDRNPKSISGTGIGADISTRIDMAVARKIASCDVEEYVGTAADCSSVKAPKLYSLMRNNIGTSDCHLKDAELVILWIPTAEQGKCIGIAWYSGVPRRFDGIFLDPL